MKVPAKIFLVLCLGIIFSCHSPQSANNRRSFLPPPEQRLVFVDLQSFPGYSENSMPPTFGTSFYASLLKNVSVELAADRSFRHLDSLLNNMNDVSPLILLRLTNSQLEHMPNGVHDDNLADLAKSMKSYSRPIYLAPGFEVNNPRLGLVSERFVKGYRYFVDKMREHGVTNVTFIWHIIAMKPRWDEPITLDACYPGDDYVDWLGLTVHNITPNHFPDDTYFESPIYDQVADFARLHHLPIMVCESSTRSIAANFGYIGDSLWVNWYEPFFNLIKKYDIRAFSHTFYQYDDNIVLTRWRQEIEKENYILAHPRPFDILGEE